MLFRTPTLTARDGEIIAGITSARATLARRLSVPARWPGMLRRSMIGRAIRGSNSIEGYVIPRDEVVAAATGETVEANVVTKLATETYRRAMTRVITLSTDPEFAWSTNVIKDLHYMMMEYDLPKKPGRWRDGPVIVVDEEKNETVYTGPEFSIVPGLMAEIVERLNTEDTSIPDIVRGAMAHLNLVMIHPFKDGNGRMARAMQTLVLGRAGKLEPIFSSIEEFLGRNTLAYYKVLASVGQGSWHPENDATEWVQFCIRAHHFQAQTLLFRTQEAESLMNSLEELVKKRGLPDRTKLALWDAALGFKVRNGTYRPEADVGAQTASRDLNALVAAGLLKAEGEKKGRFYTATQVVLEKRRRVLGGRRITDPYAEQSKAVTFSGITVTTTGTTITMGAATSSTGPTPPAVRSVTEPER